MRRTASSMFTKLITPMMFAILNPSLKWFYS
jgi:hypothetical protein